MDKEDYFAKRKIVIDDFGFFWGKVDNSDLPIIVVDDIGTACRITETGAFIGVNISTLEAANNKDEATFRAKVLGEELYNKGKYAFYLVTFNTAFDNDKVKAIIKGSKGNVREIKGIDIFDDSKDIGAELKKALLPNDLQGYYNGGGFDDDIKQFSSTMKRNTGFTNIDETMGHLYTGLYVVFAIPSLGKTTLVHQIADNMARAGNSILFFSLEMSRFEMLAKSINREGQGIKGGSLAVRYGKFERDIADRYFEAVQGRMNIIEGNFNYSVSDIAREIETFIAVKNELPTVFIDYLQLLKPVETKYKMSDKEIVDDCITQLKQLSRKYNITIICISSMNRANYATKANYTALKESGSIEYTADVIMGLELGILSKELKGTEADKRDMLEQAKGEEPRKIKMRILKNRYGRTGAEVDFEYYAKKDLFVEVAEE